MRSALLLAAGLVLVTTSGAVAQPATTVQLPSFSVFSVRTSVLVPDRGGMYLGGVNRARDGRTSRGFGPLANRGAGSDRAASGVSVHATIIDPAELDEAVLAEAAAKRGAIDPDVARAELLSRRVGKAEGNAAGLPRDEQPVESVAAIRAKNAAAAESRASEAAGYLAQAQAAEAAGKPSVAKIYYQMVVRRDVGELKQLAEARLAALSGKTTSMAKR